MNLDVRTEGNIRIFEISGDLKGEAEISALKRALDAEVRGGARRFVIDLSHVGLVNSLGIGVLVACLTSVRKRGGDAKFSGASRRVLRALDHCRLLDVVEHFPTLADARESFEAPAS